MEVESHIPTKSKSYRLSALLDAGSFFYVLTRSPQDEVVTIGQSRSGEAWKNQLPDDIDYDRSCCAIWSDHYTLVPESEFKSGDIMEYVVSATRPLAAKDYSFFADYISKSKSYVCYAVAQHLLDHLPSGTAKLKMYHFYTLAAIRGFQEPAGAVVHLSRRDHKTMMIAMDQDQLLCSTILKEVSSVTILYHLSLLSELHGLTSLSVSLSGDFALDDSTYNLLSKYYPTKLARSSLDGRDDQYQLETVLLCGS